MPLEECTHAIWCSATNDNGAHGGKMSQVFYPATKNTDDPV